MNNPDFQINPGVIGCGIFCSNLSEKAILVCLKLGIELQIYQSSTFSDRQSGAITSRSISLC
jgi:hypothetical protein